MTRHPRALEGRRGRPAGDTRHTAATTAASRVRDPPEVRGRSQGNLVSCGCTAGGCCGRSDPVRSEAKSNELFLFFGIQSHPIRADVRVRALCVQSVYTLLSD